MELWERWSKAQTEKESLKQKREVHTLVINCKSEGAEVQRWCEVQATPWWLKKHKDVFDW